jgi:NAD(P)-dependent dehydrogenase (short-subunit alcohol dehydrogenase family)
MRDVRELLDLGGRVALVTGGAGHIGSTLADTFAELGACVAIADIDGVRAERVAQTIAARRGVATFSLRADLEDEEAVRNIPAEVVRRLGSLDIVVNCAALVGTTGLAGWAVPIREQRSDAWRHALEVNLTAPFVLIQAAADALAERARGSVINILSIYGVVGPDERLYDGTSLGNPAAYGASKAALLQLTRHFATTLAPRIRVNAITPGGVARGQDASFQERYIARVPLARMASEEDFRGAAAFLGSDASAYVTGQNIVVDGGWTVW